MKEKKTISISECKDGMIIAETIFNDYGAVIVAQEAIINDNIIQKLERNGLTKVKIFYAADPESDEINAIDTDNPIFNKCDIYIETLKDVMLNINSGKEIEMEKIDGIINSIINEIKDNMDIITCIRRVREADQYIYSHCVNVALVVKLIGKWLNLDRESIKELVYAGMLHDIGKAKIDPDILNKPGQLSDEEYEEVKKHVIYGFRIIENIPSISNNIKAAVLMHHERVNGTGYVLNADVEKINLYAKIIGVADVFDAMTSNRLYRAKKTPFEVLEHIRDLAFSEFDPSIALTFLSHIANYYIGAKCKLNTGEIGEIVLVDPNNIRNPMVRIGDDCIYIENEPNMKIMEVLK